MKNKDRTQNQLSVRTQYSIIIFVILVLVGIVFLTPKRESTTLNLVQARTLVPTATTIPVPETLEEIQSNCTRGECLNACFARANSQLQMNRLDSYEYVGEEVILVHYGISDDHQLEKP